MEPTYKEKKDKYLGKINKLKSIQFTNPTLDKIKDQIDFYSFLKEVLKSTDISRGCSFNNELLIKIKIGDTTHTFTPYLRTLSTFNKMSMVIDLEELNTLINNGTTQIDLSDDDKYQEIIRNAVILGYIYLLRLNKKIRFFSINRLNPIAKAIVQMVYEINKHKAEETDEDIPPEDQC